MAGNVGIQIALAIGAGVLAWNTVLTFDMQSDVASIRKQISVVVPVVEKRTMNRYTSIEAERDWRAQALIDTRQNQDLKVLQERLDALDP